MVSNPVRMCVVTRTRLPKQELVRIVRTLEKTVKIDYNQDIPGRGAYLINRPDIIKLAQKKKVLNRHLQVEIPEEIYACLLKESI